MSASQTERVLAFLRKNPAGITSMDAFAFDPPITRLAARISDARALLGKNERIVVVNEKHSSGTHARYVLRSSPDLFESVDDWTRFADSPHKRNGHALAPVIGCEWCIRMAAINAVFDGAGAEPLADPAQDTTEPATLWDCGDAA